jgi:hypothetical protein
MNFFWVFCESISRRDWPCLWNGGLSKADTLLYPFPMWVDTIQPIKGLKRIKWFSKAELILPDYVNWFIHHLLPLVLIVGRPLNCTTCFPGSLTCRWEIMILLRLYNFMNQYFITYIIIHIYAREIYMKSICTYSYTLYTYI